MSRRAKVIVILLAVLCILELAALCWMEGPDMVSRLKYRVGDMEIGPARYSKETQEVFDLTQQGADRWAAIYTLHATSAKIKGVRFRIERFSGDAWKTMQTSADFKTGGTDKETKFYASYTPDRGGTVTFQGAAATLRDAKEYISSRKTGEQSIVGSSTLTETEKIVPGTRIVLAIFFYQDGSHAHGEEEETLSVPASPTRAYNDAASLKQYSTVIALTCQCETAH